MSAPRIGLLYPRINAGVTSIYGNKKFWFIKDGELDHVKYYYKDMRNIIAFHLVVIIYVNLGISAGIGITLPEN